MRPNKPTLGLRRGGCKHFSRMGKPPHDWPPLIDRGRYVGVAWNCLIKVVSPGNCGDARDSRQNLIADDTEDAEELHGSLRLRSGQALRRAKHALLRMTGRVWRGWGGLSCDQLGAGTPPYFCSHFNSSLTFIFPCQGFLARLWPSPGKINNLFGMPNEKSACSNR